MHRTTAGWNLCVQWKDGSTSWEKLSDLKESHPVECAECALSQGLMNEPAFNWWVGFVLKKREQIMSLVRKRNTRYLERNEKFGIALPKKEAPPPTPDSSENYVGLRLQLPRGQSLSQVRVLKRACDSDDHAATEVAIQRSFLKNLVF